MVEQEDPSLVDDLFVDWFSSFFVIFASVMVEMLLALKFSSFIQGFTLLIICSPLRDRNERRSLRFFIISCLIILLNLILLFIILSLIFTSLCRLK